MVRLGAIAVLVLICTASPASARFSADRDLAAMTKIGAEHWAKRGVNHCPTFQWQWADDFTGAQVGQAGQVDETGHLIPGACHGYLRRSTFNFPTRDRYILKMRCAIVVHEMGHGNGLEHSAGVMDGEYPAPPRECRQWAKARSRTAE